MFEPDTSKENAYQFSRVDIDHPLSTCSAYPIYLDEKNWLTSEHYYQANIVRSPELASTIENLATGKQALDLASPWYRLKIKDWKSKRKVLMTRALYTKVQMYDEVREALMATEDQLIVETSLYDYYWGMGRDTRGENVLGRIWMDIRKKLRDA